MHRGKYLSFYVIYLCIARCCVFQDKCWAERAQLEEIVPVKQAHTATTLPVISTGVVHNEKGLRYTEQPILILGCKLMFYTGRPLLYICC